MLEAPPSCGGMQCIRNIPPYGCTSMCNCRTSCSTLHCRFSSIFSSDLMVAMIGTTGGRLNRGLPATSKTKETATTDRLWRAQPAKNLLVGISTSTTVVSRGPRKGPYAPARKMRAVPTKSTPKIPVSLAPGSSREQLPRPFPLRM